MKTKHVPFQPPSRIVFAMGLAAALVTAGLPASLASASPLAPTTALAATATTALRDGNYTYDVNADGTATITAYGGSAGTISVPATLGGKTVTAIGDGAFKNHGSLRQVILPGTITSIRDNAFAGCTRLTSVKISEGVTFIGANAFKDCTSLASATVPASLTRCGMTWTNGIMCGPFAGCSALAEVNVAEGASAVAPFLLSGVTSKALTLSVPASVSSISKSALMGVPNLSIKARPGTYAESYARANGYAYVDSSVHANAISINASTLTLTVGGSQRLTAITTPASITDPVTWSSSNPSVARVSAEGVVTATGSGSAVITAATGSVSSTCIINVWQPVTSISLAHTDIWMEVETVRLLSASALPESASNRAITWTSSNPRVATVNAYGYIEASAQGTTTITASATDGSGVSASALVHVYNTKHVARITASLQSSHPYPNNYQDFWVYTIPGASRIGVTFDERTSFENTFDCLYVFDQWGNRLGSYTANQLAGKTIYVDGDTVRLQMDTDEAGNDWGFAVSQIWDATYNGLTVIDGVTYYYDYGKPHKGALLFADGWHFFDMKTGAQVTGMTELPDGRVVYFYDNGVLATSDVIIGDTLYSIDPLTSTVTAVGPAHPEPGPLWNLAVDDFGRVTTDYFSFDLPMSWVGRTIVTMHPASERGYECLTVALASNPSCELAMFRLADASTPSSGTDVNMYYASWENGQGKRIELWATNWAEMARQHFVDLPADPTLESLIGLLTNGAMTLADARSATSPIVVLEGVEDVASSTRVPFRNSRGEVAYLVPVTIERPDPAPVIVQVAVPDIVGKKAQEGSNVLTDARLNASVITTVAAPEAAKEGMIYQTNPVAGTLVDEGSFVEVYVYGAYVPPMVKIPDVAGKTGDAAKAALEAVGFKASVKTIGDAPSAADEGIAYKTDPVAGKELQEGSEVTVLVWGAYVPPMIEVPDLVGLGDEAAAQALEAVGLHAALYQGDPAPAPEQEKTVYKTEPSSNGLMEQGGSVTVFVWGAYVPPMVEIPDVAGKAGDAAKAALEAAGFAASVTTGDAAPAPDQEGIAYKTDPVAGKELQEGSEVTVFVWGAYVPPMVEVPEVTGMAADAAEAAVEAAELVANVITGEAAPSSGQEGIAYKSEPSGNALAEKGSTVTIYVWGAYVPPMVEIPDVAGKAGEAAKAALEAAGFAASVTTGEGAAAPDQEGIAYKTDPAAGKELQEGSSVTVYVYGAYVPPMVEVPETSGMTATDAKAALEGAGLVVSLVTGEEAPSAELSGTVIRTEPSGDALVEKGSAITAYVYDEFVPRIAVPNVVWASGDDASAALQFAGLKPGIVIGETAPAIEQAGLVYATDPAADAIVKQGATVTCYVYAMPTVSVPSVVGMSAEDAAGTLQWVGLNATVTPGQADPSFSQIGTVYSTDPVAESTIPMGSTVTCLTYTTPTSAVPNLIGMTTDAASDALQAVGLWASLGQGGPAPTAEQSGTVYYTDPEAGTVIEQGSPVTCWFYAPVTEVPSVIGMSTDNANWALQSAGLQPAFAEGTPAPNFDQAGLVERTDPAAGGVVEPGGSVTCYTYTNPVATVPEVVGMTPENANVALRNVGLWANPAQGGPAPTVEQSEIVYYTEPAAGAVIEQGSPVTCWFYAPVVSVPNVIGMAETDAAWLIQTAGLVPAVIPGEAAPTAGQSGTVYATDPAADGVVEQGGTVTCWVYAPSSEVPNVIGMSTDDANWALQLADLWPTFAAGEPAATFEQVGLVYVTDPAAGAVVAQGGSVTCYTYTNPVASVPELAGMSLDDASAALQAVGLWANPGQGGPAPTVEQSGTVYLTEPAAGAVIEQGSPVTCWFYAPVVSVPNVVGMSTDDANWALQLAGLWPTFAAGEPAATFEQVGMVYYTEPAAESILEQGGSVTCYTYTNPVATVPELAGMSLDDASATLQAVGLWANPWTGDAAPTDEQTGLVYYIEPAAGAVIEQGSPVTCYTYAPASTVPELVGMTANDASVALQAAGLWAAPTFGDSAPTIEQSGIVYYTEPAGGARVAQGESVTCWVYDLFYPQALFDPQVDQFGHVTTNLCSFDLPEQWVGQVDITPAFDEQGIPVLRITRAGAPDQLLLVVRAAHAGTYIAPEDDLAYVVSTWDRGDGTIVELASAKVTETLYEYYTTNMMPPYPTEQDELAMIELACGSRYYQPDVATAASKDAARKMGSYGAINVGFTMVVPNVSTGGNAEAAEFVSYTAEEKRLFLDHPENLPADAPMMLMGMAGAPSPEPDLGGNMMLGGVFAPQPTLTLTLALDNPYDLERANALLNAVVAPLVASNGTTDDQPEAGTQAEGPVAFDRAELADANLEDLLALAIGALMGQDDYEGIEARQAEPVDGVALDATVPLADVLAMLEDLCGIELDDEDLARIPGVNFRVEAAADGTQDKLVAFSAKAIDDLLEAAEKTIVVATDLVELPDGTFRIDFEAYEAPADPALAELATAELTAPELRELLGNPERVFAGSAVVELAEPAASHDLGQEQDLAETDESIVRLVSFELDGADESEEAAPEA